MNRALNAYRLIADDHSNVVLCDNVALSRNAEEILLSKWMPSLLRVGSDLPASLLDLRSSSVDSLCMSHLIHFVIIKFVQ